MSNRTANSFFISSSGIRFYQQLLSGLATYEELGNRIVAAARTAQAFRQMEQVRELTRILLQLPVREYRLIGEYYSVWCDCRENTYHTNTLERIIEQTHTYKTQALLSRAAMEGYQGNIESELYFYTESLKTASSLSDHIEAARCVAIAKAQEGFHKSALKDLEALIPIRRYAEPLVYYSLLNSYAVELAEVGRIEEASNVSKVVLTSSLAPAYPEWRETAAEIHSKTKKRSTVHISIKEPVDPGIEELLAGLPEDEIDAEVARMFDQEFAPGVPQPYRPEIEEGSNIFYQIAEMGPGALLAVLLRMVLRNRITEKEIQLICDMFYHNEPPIPLASEPQIKSYDQMPTFLNFEPEYPKFHIGDGPRKQKSEHRLNKVDLESQSYVESLIINWCNHDITPEQIAAVVSALRDCKDDLKRTTIMDRMINIAFQQSTDGFLSETEWRKKYEARLSAEDEASQ